MLSKFKYTDKQISEILLSMTILIDTREQQNSHIIDYFESKNIKYKIKKLDFGDYSFFIPQNEILSIPRDLYFDKDISIERKGSLEELSGNLTQQRDRFEKELSLYKGKMYLLIENGDYQNIYEGKYNTQYNKKSYVGSLHSFENKYNLPFTFMPNNKISPVFIYCTFYYYLKNLLNS